MSFTGRARLGPEMFGFPPGVGGENVDHNSQKQQTQ